MTNGFSSGAMRCSQSTPRGPSTWMRAGGRPARLAPQFPQKRAPSLLIYPQLGQAVPWPGATGGGPVIGRGATGATGATAGGAVTGAGGRLITGGAVVLGVEITMAGGAGDTTTGGWAGGGAGGVTITGSTVAGAGPASTGCGSGSGSGSLNGMP